MFVNNDLGNTDVHIDWLIGACFQVSTLTGGPAGLKVFVLTPSQNTSLPTFYCNDRRIRKHMAFPHKPYVLIKIECNCLSWFSVESFKDSPYSRGWKSPKVCMYTMGKYFPTELYPLPWYLKHLSYCLELLVLPRVLHTLEDWKLGFSLSVVLFLRMYTSWFNISLFLLLWAHFCNKGCSELISIASIIASDHMGRDLPLTYLFL